MRRCSLTMIGLCIVSGSLFGAHPPGNKSTAADIEFFESKVRPILAEKCVTCHGPKKQMAGLRLDSAAGVKAGGDGGPVVLPGDPAKSPILKAVRREVDSPMPPNEALPPTAVAALTEWVRIGAPFPDATQSHAAGPNAAAANHWAFQPVRDPAVPAAKTVPPTANPVDRFVAVKLEEKGLAHSPPADKRTLLRRAYFDLIGLPPSADEVAAFENDSSPGAFAAAVDRLLASPHYGERWARYWLDVARYSDTKGYVFQEDRNFPYAYTYRDYVIRSLNEDKPYDRFVIEQVAADRLPSLSDKRDLAALGFLTLGRRFLNNQPDIIDDQLDVVCRGFMALTVGCARCHDHKYDPIPAKDYYSLYGVFASCTEPKELPLIGAVERTKEVEAFEAELRKREGDVTTFRTKRHQEIVALLRTKEEVARYLLAATQARGKSDEAAQKVVRAGNLRRAAFARWADYLAKEAKAPSPVFAPWFALATLPEGEFEKQATSKLDGFARGQKNELSVTVAAAIATAKPTSLADVAKVYGTLLTGGSDTALAAVLGPGGPTDVPAAETDRLFDRADRNRLTDLQRKVDKLRASSPFAPPRAMVVQDNPKPFDPYVFVRGNPGNRGPAVPRQMVAVVAGPGRKPFGDGSGRLDFARAIASPANPLTARVIVNRVWMHHFGKGLVTTPSDFGTRSDPPSHPELLDWLATRFVTDDGWSLKKLHRRIMLSATYQQASAERPDSSRVDPENRLLGRMNRRRLDFEALRDALLSVAGHLDTRVGGRSVDLFDTPFPKRRSVYAFIDRQNLPGTLRAFDFASPDQHTPQRFQTTVPQQALFLMNNPFVAEQARALAARPAVSAATTTPDKIDALYRVAFGRPPTTEEVALGVDFVRAAAWTMFSAKLNPWEQYAQVLLVSNEFAFVD